MTTTSEYAVTITIWVLTLVGIYFGGRASWRRKRDKRTDGKKSSSRELKGAS